ncbi:MAG: hypothetical protein V8S33_03660 [Intestinibacter bartlettii]
MEAEKIFCKNLDQFSKDNDISKNKFYRNIENVISYYGIKKEYIKILEKLILINQEV